MAVSEKHNMMRKPCKSIPAQVVAVASSSQASGEGQKSGTSTLFGRWRLVFQYLSVPGEDAVEPIEEMFLFAEAVRLAGVDDQSRFEA